MKLHLTQKIGLAGIVFVVLIALLLLAVDHFSPFVFIGTIPFFVLLLAGYYLKSKKRRNTI